MYFWKKTKEGGDPSKEFILYIIDIWIIVFERQPFFGTHVRNLENL
jgi:hypothetical protein